MKAGTVRRKAQESKDVGGLEGSTELCVQSLGQEKSATLFSQLSVR